MEKEKKEKSINEELDEIIELKRIENSAWKKIIDSLKPTPVNPTQKIKK